MLGKGQSVVFCVSDEIQTKIQRHMPEPDGAGIDVLDILMWVIYETWMDTRRNIPMWATQGKRYRKHAKLWATYRTKDRIGFSKNDAESFLEDEAQTLDARYRPHSRGLTEGAEPKNNDPIAQRCREFNISGLHSASLREEQERELSPEVEQERQIQRPRAAKPAAHSIHPDIRRFVSEARLPAGSKACMPAFKALSNTSAADHLNLAKYSGALLVSADFARTVDAYGASYVSDSYQRSVQWILTSTRGDASPNGVIKHMIIISPYEAQELLPEITKSKAVALHLYAPRPNLGFHALDTLDLYTVPKQPRSRIPRPLIVELNLFAGQLYVESFEGYVELCGFLGVDWQDAEEGSIPSDSFIVQNDGTRARLQPLFQENPVKFLKVLMMKIRRNCQGISKTHVGLILDNRLLRPGDFP